MKVKKPSCYDQAYQNSWLLAFANLGAKPGIFNPPTITAFQKIKRKPDLSGLEWKPLSRNRGLMAYDVKGP
jgi:hypothetical protein